MALSRTVVGIAAALAIAGAFAPALASAQTYYYGTYGNTGTLSTNCAMLYYNGAYPANYNNGYYPNTSCPPQGSLLIYLHVNAPQGSYYGNRQSSDFTVSIYGGNPHPATIQGSESGRLVSVLGSYSVNAASFQGFTPSYSTGCSGTLSQGQQNTCVITENPVYPANYYPNAPYYNQYPYQAPYVQQAPAVYVTPTYIPTLPNTGFEPLSGASLAFALVALLAAAFVSLPYVRKALAVILG